MGLKQVKFIDWFQSKFSMSVRSVPNQEGSHFDSVFIDINCLIHPSVRAASNEAMFVKKLFSILDKLLAQFIPSRICYLSVDGPAPIAKILTQKARRAAKGSKPRKGMSTLQITPGCPFMARLEHYLSYYSVRYLQHRQQLGISPDLKFVIDHSNNPGEGENKIIENIVQQASNIRGRPCAIIAMDSDAIIQAIALGIPNIYVIRKDSPANPAIVISIDKFMRTLEEIFPGESNRVRLDFCALCLFRGNDYLRGLHVSLEKLWTSYLFTKLIDPEIKQRGALRFLIDSDYKTFDLFFLRKLILNSYKDPRQLQQTLQEAQESNPILPSLVTNKLGNLEIKNEGDTDSPDENKSDSETEGDSELTSKEEEDDDDEEDEEDEEEEEEEEEDDDDMEAKDYSMKKFLAGVLWNIEMYCSGTCPDISFCYEYQCGPPRKAVVTYVDSVAQTKRHSTLLPSTTNGILSVARSDKKYLHPLVCGLILLPLETGSAYLPKSISPFHSQIVSSESEHPTQDEMEAIDLKVSGLIEILESSGKGNDAVIAKELSGLYMTRPPYIWTRVRVVNPNSKPIAMPVSPNVIIDQLNDTKTADAGKTSAATTTLHKFSALQEQPDIKCNMVRVPPNVVQTQSSESNAKGRASPVMKDNISIQWTTIARQQATTLAGKAPATVWPFHYIRGIHNRKNVGGSPQVGQHRLQHQSQNQGQDHSKSHAQNQSQNKGQNQKKSTAHGQRGGSRERNRRPKQKQDVSATSDNRSRGRRRDNKNKDNSKQQLPDTEKIDPANTVDP
ncbi:hypothetical protein BGZ80_009243 [Entomortierella chlamydospora]|uniref:Xrn1 N-terminal domain-containing protein n=1 Tax=Entomortierella chlamydospora TaxID=101097 RepID=A0A9P6MXI6_9FUNG|nr:hypothetical protein BGZ79_006000 [Entomortierella chlamydospora]KAG0016406.1 hypothetical protein BGZ80_009243 [Entomortierella chlamydospora]